MRTHIDIDYALMDAAMDAAQLPTKKATVEETLRRLVRQSRQRQALADLRGQGWEGDLSAQRARRVAPPE